MTAIKPLFIFSVVTFLISCECSQKISGVVLDKATMKPLKNVAVSKSMQKDFANNFSSPAQYSDSTGHYEYTSFSGGLFRCPPLKLYFMKNGYQIIKLNFNNVGSDTVLLEKVN